MITNGFPHAMAVAAARAGSQFGTSDAINVRSDAGGEQFAQLDENVRLGLEKIFVEVVFALAAAAQCEIPAKQRDIGDAFGQFGLCHGGNIAQVLARVNL
jgi:hypothetical protein